MKFCFRIGVANVCDAGCFRALMRTTRGLVAWRDVGLAVVGTVMFFVLNNGAFVRAREVFEQDALCCRRLLLYLHFRILRQWQRRSKAI